MALEEHKQQHNPPPVWIPTDIIVKILLHLPVLSLLRCKSVCKLWHSIISEPRFVKSHLSLAPRCRQLISFDTHYKSFRLYHHVNVVELGNPFTPIEDGGIRIVGSCNGLVCIINVVIGGYSPIFIWNPSTRRVNLLPSSGSSGGMHEEKYDECFNAFVGSGFGYDESNDDYKVVEISSDDPIRPAKTRVKIYSLKSGYWKSIICDLTCHIIRPEPGMFFNGALHWIIAPTDLTQSSGYPFGTIVSFDLATETFGEILQPVYDKEHSYLSLCTFGEWLSVVCYIYWENRADVWVMKVYGVQDSWVKLVFFPHLTITEELPLCLTTLCVTEDGKFLLKLKKELILYDPKDSSFTVIHKIGTYNRAVTFVESLLSPMPVRYLDAHGFFNSIT